MYIVKVRKHDGKGEILNVLHYNHIENAIADVVNRIGDVFEPFVSDDFYTGHSSIRMRSFSTRVDENNDEISDDFEIYFDAEDIFVYIGTFVTMD